MTLCIASQRVFNLVVVVGVVYFVIDLFRKILNIPSYRAFLRIVIFNLNVFLFPSLDLHFSFLRIFCEM
jgi:hypothetical protein